MKPSTEALIYLSYMGSLIPVFVLQAPVPFCATSLTLCSGKTAEVLLLKLQMTTRRGQTEGHVLEVLFKNL